jgi:DNA ligase (NAD+)
MNRAEAASRIANLRDEVRRHDHLYYAKAAPEIGDEEYDRLLAELQALEAQHPDLVTPDSPTQRVGGSPSTEFPTFTHKVPMLSLDNTYSEDELREFEERIFRAVGKREMAYVAELKMTAFAATRSRRTPARSGPSRCGSRVRRLRTSKSAGRSTCRGRALRRSTASAKSEAKSRSPTRATRRPAP